MVPRISPIYIKYSSAESPLGRKFSRIDKHVTFHGTFSPIKTRRDRQFIRSVWSSFGTPQRHGDQLRPCSCCCHNNLFDLVQHSLLQCQSLDHRNNHRHEQVHRFHAKHLVRQRSRRLREPFATSSRHELTESI